MASALRMLFFARKQPCPLCISSGIAAVDNMGTLSEQVGHSQTRQNLSTFAVRR